MLGIWKTQVYGADRLPRSRSPFGRGSKHSKASSQRLSLLVATLALAVASPAHAEENKPRKVLQRTLELDGKQHEVTLLIKQLFDGRCAFKFTMSPLHADVIGTGKRAHRHWFFVDDNDGIVVYQESTFLGAYEADMYQVPPRACPAFIREAKDFWVSPKPDPNK